MRLGSCDVARGTRAVLVFVAQKRRRCKRVCAVCSLHLCDAAVRFVTSEEMVAPCDRTCFDISIKIDDLDSDDDDDDDHDDDDDDYDDDDDDA